jgi:cyclophilin family peptidyl-prolyl cis-trans isomerase/predicted nucleic acid-binding Zn ribbon protein
VQVTRAPVAPLAVQGTPRTATYTRELTPAEASVAAEPATPRARPVPPEECRETVPTNKQRREAAQRHLQRQLERRAEQTTRRRRNMGIVAALVAALVVAAVILLGTGVFDGGDDSDVAAASSSAPASDPAAPDVAAAPSTNADGTVACDYAPAQGGEIIDVGTPPEADAVSAEGTVALSMVTNQGDLTLTLDRSLAPCAVESFTYLASQDFFDGTPCHRLTTFASLSVLQCGDPTGTGTGGPSYRYAEEVTPQTSYPRGTVAMAKSAAPSSTGSQFFLVYGDSQLPPEYTVVGTVDEAGLAVLDAIAAAGVEGGAEDGPPAEEVTIDELQLVA